MGTVGVQEMVVIFIIALVLFGPKKLPELGRTIGKAITEFRRASSDLKASFEREMQNLERETDKRSKVTADAYLQWRSNTIAITNSLPPAEIAWIRRVSEADTYTPPSRVDQIPASHRLHPP